MNSELRRCIAFALVSGDLGGGQRIALTTAKALLERGWGLAVIAPSDGESVEAFSALEAQIEITGPIRTFDVAQIARVRRFLIRTRAICTYTHSVPTHEVVVGLAARSAGTRLVLHRHIIGSFSSSSTIRLFQTGLWRYILRRADEIVSVSDQVREQLLDVAGVESHLVPNGTPVVDVGSHKDRAEVVIGSVARIDPNKRVEDLIDAAAIVCGSEPLARFVLVGGGLGDEYERSCRERVTRLGLQQRFVFVGARDGREAIADFDVFVLPSVLEGHPLALLEAMSYGKPVVVSDIPGHRETVTDRVHGRVVRPRDPVAIASAVIELVRSPPLREAWGDAGAERVRQEFSEDRMVRALVSVVDP